MRIDYYRLSAWIIALEDKRYLVHFGVDLIAMFRAATLHIIGRGHGGASTLEMQLHRTISGDREKTLARKVRECCRAAVMTRKFSKSQVLYLYIVLGFVSTDYHSMETTANELSAEFQEEFPELELFLACLLKYPIPRDKGAKWKDKLTQRYKYGLKREAIMRHNLALVQRLSRSNKDLSKL